MANGADALAGDAAQGRLTPKLALAPVANTGDRGWPAYDAGGRTTKLFDVESRVSSTIRWATSAGSC